ncbi:unnamed protein product, partial [Closterium sp. Naga37s-1]
RSLTSHSPTPTSLFHSPTFPTTAPLASLSSCLSHRPHLAQIPQDLERSLTSHSPTPTSLFHSPTFPTTAPLASLSSCLSHRPHLAQIPRDLERSLTSHSPTPTSLFHSPTFPTTAPLASLSSCLSHRPHLAQIPRDLERSLTSHSPTPTSLFHSPTFPTTAPLASLSSCLSHRPHLAQIPRDLERSLTSHSPTPTSLFHSPTFPTTAPLASLSSCLSHRPHLAQIPQDLERSLTSHSPTPTSLFHSPTFPTTAPLASLSSCLSHRPHLAQIPRDLERSLTSHSPTPTSLFHSPTFPTTAPLASLSSCLSHRPHLAQIPRDLERSLTSHSPTPTSLFHSPTFPTTAPLASLSSCLCHRPHLAQIPRDLERSLTSHSPTPTSLFHSPTFPTTAPLASLSSCLSHRPHLAQIPRDLERSLTSHSPTPTSLFHSPTFPTTAPLASLSSCLSHRPHLAQIPRDLEVAYIPFSQQGTFPGIFLFSAPARFVRPVRQLPSLNPRATAAPTFELIGSLEQVGWGGDGSSLFLRRLKNCLEQVVGRSKLAGQAVKYSAASSASAASPPLQVFLDVLCPDGSSPSPTTDQGSAAGSATHEEVRPTDILSVMASLTPWSDYNQSPRNMYQCQMGKQTMGMPLHSFPFRNDNKLYRLQTPQTPIARTAAYDDYAMDQYPTGANAVVAVLAYTGYDMEDAMIINKSSMERGFGHGYIYKNEVIEATQGSASRVAKFTPSGLPVQMLGRPAIHRRGHKWTIDTDGLPRPGEHITSGDVYACKVNTVTGKADEIKLKGSEDAVVDGVTLIGTGPKTALTKASVRMRFGRLPQIGDKFSSRHGQKGVLSQLWPDVDMPFASSSGMRPDIIINPHAFPSRMTIGMLVESVAAKSGSLHGNFVDASPFRPATVNPPPLTMSLKSRQPAQRRGASRLARPSAATPGLSTPVHRSKLHKKSGAPPTPATPVTPAAAAGAEKGAGSFTPLDLPTPASSAKPSQAAKPAAGPATAGGPGESNPPQNNGDLVDTFGRQLVEKGFSYYGTETMYSGVYGCEMECEIYLGVVYYQRLRHMVSDKFQVRSTGPVNPLTQQPVKGRKKGGGVRFGEMERDAMLSHGAAYLLHDRLHSCSDYHTTEVCSLCGSLLAPALARPRGGSAGSDAAVALGLGLGAGVGYGTVGGELRQKKMVCRVCGTGKGVVRVAMPYVFKYLAAELAAMNIKLTLGV